MAVNSGSQLTSQQCRRLDQIEVIALRLLCHSFTAQVFDQNSLITSLLMILETLVQIFVSYLEKIIFIYELSNFTACTAHKNAPHMQLFVNKQLSNSCLGTQSFLVVLCQLFVQVNLYYSMVAVACNLCNYFKTTYIKTCLR